MSPDAGPAAEGVAPGGAGDGDEPAHGLGDDVVGRPVLVGARAGPGVAETSDGRVDQPGSHRPHRVVADAEAVHDAGLRVLDERVRPFDEPQQRVAAVGGLEVEHDAALVAVDAGEVAAVRPLAVLPRERPAVARHVPGRRLDLDHVRAEVGQQHRAERPGQRLRGVDDPQARQRAGRPGRHRRRAHGPPQWLRRFTSTVRSPSKTIVPSWLAPQCRNRTRPASSRSAPSTARTSLNA